MEVLEEVLKVIEVTEVDKFNKVVPDLQKKVDALRDEVINEVESIYIKHSRRYQQNKELLNKALRCRESLTTLKCDAEAFLEEGVVKANDELKKNIDSLETLHVSSGFVLGLERYLQLLHEFVKEFEADNYLECVKILKNLNVLMQETTASAGDKLKVICELDLDICAKNCKIKSTLEEICTNCVNILEHVSKKTSIIQIKRNCGNLELAMQALYYQEECVPVLNSLAKSLWDLVLVPLVEHTVTIKETTSSDCVSLSIEIVDIKLNPDYKNFFDNIHQVLQFFLNNFNYNVAENLTVLEYIGNDIRDNLSELIIKKCLRNTIPKDAEGLESYKTVIEDTEALEQALLTAQIFKEDTASILDYAKNVNELYIENKCQGYLEEATKVMKMDLHDTVAVGVPYNPESLLGHHVDEFPHCLISRNVQELLNSSEDIMQEALNPVSKYRAHLLATVQKIFEKYAEFVPEYHKNYLQNLPQQIALFYNNCFYISYNLSRWNEKYCKDNCENTSLNKFSNIATKLRLVAVEMFANYFKAQVDQINEIMNGAKLNGPVIETVDPVTEKCVRQCLRQQELLKTVLQKVLPYAIYNNSLGSVVDALSKFLITSILGFQDIPADVSEKLASIIKIVLTRAPKLFTDPNEISIFVPTWRQLYELNFVLNGNLEDIGDRWADGEGPLSLQFTAEELKGLIEALFQNTNRRAAVLSKIR